MSGNSLQALSSSVKSATDPVLLQQALAAFATKTPACFRSGAWIPLMTGSMTGLCK